MLFMSFMKKFTSILVPAVLAALVSGCSGGKVSGGNHTAVWSDGTWLRDTQGRVIIVHGMNVSETAKHSPYQPFTVTTLTGSTLTQNLEQNFARMKGLGLNVVRLLVLWAGLEPTPGTINTGYLDQIEAEVQACKDNGLWVLLDMHQDLYSESFCFGDGAPSWACDLTGYDVSQCTINTSNPNIALWGLNYTLPGVRQSFQNLWDDAPALDGLGLQEHYRAALQALARTFSPATNLLGYDIMNEPYPGTYPLFTPAFEQQALVPFYEKMVKGIRAADPVHVIAFEAANPLCSVATGFKTGISQTTFSREFPGLLFEPHFYPLNPVDVSSIAPGLTALKTLGLIMKVPWLVGEFGVNYTTPGSAEYLLALLNSFDTCTIGWIEWSYDGDYAPGPYDTTRPDMSPYYPDGTPRPLTDKSGTQDFYGIDIISRPYPMLTAGTPVSIGYPITADPGSFTTTAFTYTYKEDGIGHGATEIFLPPAHFPEGFTVTTSDGTASFDTTTDILSYYRGPRSVHTITVAPCDQPGPACIGVSLSSR